MSGALVVTGGDDSDQLEPHRPLPALDSAVAQSWLLAQAEYKPEHQLWIMPGLTAEIYPEQDDGALRMITFMVSVTDPAQHDSDYVALKQRLRELAGLLGVRVWDDDEGDFLADA